MRKGVLRPSSSRARSSASRPPSARSLKRVTSAVRAHLDEALARSFLSNDFKSRLSKLVAAHMKVLEACE